MTQAFSLDGTYIHLRPDESALAMAEGDRVMVHGRFSNTGRQVAWIAVDIVRIEDTYGRI